MITRRRAACVFPVLLLAIPSCRTAAPVPVADVAPAVLRFEPVSNALTEGVFGSPGSAWADADGDGYVDVAIAARDSHPNRVYRGTANGFERLPLETPLGRNANAIAWGDIDNDGDLDLAIGMPELTLYETHVEGGRIRLDSVPLGGALTAGQRPRGPLEALAFGDVDRDGDLDLAIGSHGPAGAFLLLNDGSGRFAIAQRDAFPFASSMGGVHMADLDGDARSDLLFTGGAFPNFRTGSFAYWNDAEWTADRAAAFSAQPGGLGSSIADIDNDGDFDAFVAGWREATPSVLYENMGERRFVARDTLPARIIGSAFGDIDNDGDIDLVTSSGYTNVGAVQVWLNDGGGNLRGVAVPGLTDQPGAYTGLNLVDYDRDGRLDIFVSSITEPSRLWRNVSALSTQWLQVEVRAAAGGAPVYPALVVAEFDGPRGRVVRRALVHQQGGYAGHGEPVAHFGIAAGQRLRQVSVDWSNAQRVRIDGQLDQRTRVASPARRQ